MYKIKSLLIILIFFFPKINTAQITQKVAKSFPAYVVFEINKLISKINLEEKKQIQIGQKLVKQDSLATILLSKGESTEILKNYYTIDATFLAGILSTEELEHFMYENDNTNRFLLALKLSDTLRLKAEQINQIRKENSFLSTQNNINSENKYKLYIDKLSTILDSKQYVILIKTIYVDKSLEETNKDWDNIKKAKLAENKDSITVYKELYKYNLYKNSYLDSYANKYDLKKSNELKTRITLEKQPSILTHYNIQADYIYKINLFSTAIKYEKELALSSTQIDSLLSNYREVELMEFKDVTKNPLLKKYSNYTAFENNKITTILDAQQILTLLIEKNRKNATQLAYENWDELEAKEMTNNLDKKQTIKEFAVYLLNYLVATDRLKMNKNATNIFYKRDVELKKPDLLKQLDEIKKTEQSNKNTKNALKW